MFERGCLYLGLQSKLIKKDNFMIQSSQNYKYAYCPLKLWEN